MIRVAKAASLRGRPNREQTRMVKPDKADKGKVAVGAAAADRILILKEEKALQIEN